ncbi:MAG: alanine racemase, partial [Chitinophagales bacterium]
MTDTYFSQLNQALQNHHRAIPFLIIDLDRLGKNIETLKSKLKPDADFRIVVKSLPSFDLLQYVMQRANTSKLMVFHQPFLTDLSKRLGSSTDILLGKPMPIKTANYYYQSLENHSTNSHFNPFQQVQWLIDTPKRVIQYLDLAKKWNQKLRLNLEIDVGLHRGGFVDLPSLSAALQIIQNNAEHLQFSGLMGYDPHVVKLPKIVRTPKKALQLANDFYDECKNLIQKEFPELWSDDLTFNGAGSPTINLHQKDTPLNDIAAGSCLVKPTTFDIPTLSEYQPACFIAAPVLKKLKGTTLPAMEKFKGFWNVVNKANQQTFFIYGGFWKADYCYPKGIQ